MNHIGQFIINHWAQWLLFIIILLFIFINELLTQKKRAKELSPHAAVALINDNEQVVLIDLRDKESYRKGHIINSIQAGVEDFDQSKMDKYKSKTVILICPRGLQSRVVAAKLRSKGFLHPIVLAGGLSAWQNAGLPLIKK